MNLFRSRLLRLFLIALALRLLWMAVALALGVEQTSDAGWYHARGVEIALGGGYTIDGAPTAYWPVGWPGFLGVLYTFLGISPVVGLVANALLGALSASLTFLIARRLLANERVAWIAGVLVALHPNHVVYAGLLMSEPTALVLLLGGLLLLWRAGEERLVWSVLAGVLIGALVLVKPQYAMLAVIGSGKWGVGSRGRGWRRYLTALGIAGVVAAGVCAPWVMRNAELYGAAPVLSNNDGVNLWFGNNPHATGAYISDSTVDALYTVPGENEYQANVRARRLALDYITSHPVEAIARVPRKLWYLWRADTEGFTLAARGLPEGSSAAAAVGVLKYLAQGWWILFVGAFLWNIVQHLRNRIPRERWSWAPLLAVVIVSLWGALWFGDGRFHYPAIPFMAVAVGSMGARSEK